MKEVRAKKSLGQNFLKNKRVLQKVVDVSDLKKNDLVLEVGPGKGALTEKILKTGVKVLVIEKDYRMIPILEHKFAKQISAKQLQVFEGDALKVDCKKLNLKNKSFKVIANLPYYITGKFLSNILSCDIQPETLVLMLQKAVVERIVLRHKPTKNKKSFKENLLSLSVKVYGKPEFIMSVSAKNFSPIPKVDSAILKVSKISKDFFVKSKIDDKKFFEFLKISFSGKRKRMIKNLVNKKFYCQKVERNTANSKQLLNKSDLEKIFQDLKINSNTRAEDLSLKDFKNIYKKLKNTWSMIKN